MSTASLTGPENCPVGSGKLCFPCHGHRLALPPVRAVPKAINHLKMEMVESFPLKKGKAYKNTGRERVRGVKDYFPLCQGGVSTWLAPLRRFGDSQLCLSARIGNRLAKGEAGSQVPAARHAAPATPGNHALTHSSFHSDSSFPRFVSLCMPFFVSPSFTVSHLISFLACLWVLILI